MTQRRGANRPEPARAVWKDEPSGGAVIDHTLRDDMIV
jgi:hypothetical protein